MTSFNYPDKQKNSWLNKGKEIFYATEVFLIELTF